MQLRLRFSALHGIVWPGVQLVRPLVLWIERVHSVPPVLTHGSAFLPLRNWIFAIGGLHKLDSPPHDPVRRTGPNGLRRIPRWAAAGQAARLGPRPGASRAALGAEKGGMQVNRFTCMPRFRKFLGHLVFR